MPVFKMKLLVVLVVCVFAAASGKQLPPSPLELTAYDYLRRFGIPRAEEIRKFEEQLQDDPGRIVGGSESHLGQFPYQAGLFLHLSFGTGFCGGSLISPTRGLTAAHCWFDGINRVMSLTVVLGSARLYSGGTRVETSNVQMHQYWNPSWIRNDVALIHLPSPVTLSNTIAPVALPSGPQLNEIFVGEIATASGFGRTVDGGPVSESLNHVDLSVISNQMCSMSFPIYMHSTNICTSGANGRGTCQGDSGGPLVVTRGNQRILIGITSFGSTRGCQLGDPAAFARVTSFMDFILS